MKKDINELQNELNLLKETLKSLDTGAKKMSLSAKIARINNDIYQLKIQEG